MRYTFDSGPFINLRYYYSSVFTSFWEQFDQIVAGDEIIAAREVYNEISRRGDFVSEWADENRQLFQDPTPEELTEAQRILHRHPELIRRQNIAGGLPVADPFVIAQGYCRGLIVVSNEMYTPNAHKIPNICEEMNVPHMNFDGFMENEGWAF